MKKICVKEDWCLGCHLCEYNCAFANSGEVDMVKAFMRKEKPISRIRVEEAGDVHFAVSCRHCTVPLCVKSCITGALSIQNGVISVNENKCVGCYTCVLACPYGCIVTSEQKKAVQKCELCTKNGGQPQCVLGCPNGAILYEEVEQL